MTIYKPLKIVAISLLLVWMTSGTPFAESFSMVEGTIQGASCTIHKSRCPLNTSDPHVELEHDFVVVTDTGDYFFLPNVSRVIKVQCLNQQVRITGDKKEGLIVVSKIDVKKGDKYNVVWDWQTIKEINEISY